MPTNDSDNGAQILRELEEASADFARKAGCTKEKAMAKILASDPNIYKKWKLAKAADFRG
jgi:hypothetical protein